MIEDMTVRNLSPATQRSYLYAVTKFSRFFRRSADRMSVEDVCAVVRNNRHDSAYLDEPAALKVRSPPPQRAWMSFARIWPACSSPSASITSARRGAPPGSHHRLVQVDVLQFNVRDLDIPTRLHHPTKRIRKATISENNAIASVNAKPSRPVCCIFSLASGLRAMELSHVEKIFPALLSFEWVMRPVG